MPGVAMTLKRVITIALTLIVGVMATLLVLRELRPSSSTPQRAELAPAPDLADWHVLQPEGVLWGRELTYEGRDLERAPQWSVSPLPDGVPDVHDSVEFDLTDMHRVVALADGRVVTLSWKGSRILVFAADGRGERSIGRRGRGPGELSNVTSLARFAGDSLAMLDGVNRRIYIATARDGIVRTRAFDEGEIGDMHLVAGVLPDEQIVLNAGDFHPKRAPGESGVRVAVDVAVLPPVGRAVTIAAIPSSRYREVESRSSPSGRIVEPVRLSPRAHIAVWDSLIVTSSADSYHVDLRTADGQVVGTLGVKRRLRPVTPAMRRLFVEREIEWLRAASEPLRDPSESERAVRAAPFADSLPAFDALYVSPDNVLWIVDGIAPGDGEWFATGFSPRWFHHRASAWHRYSPANRVWCGPCGASGHGRRWRGDHPQACIRARSDALSTTSRFYCVNEVTVT